MRLRTALDRLSHCSSEVELARILAVLPIQSTVRNCALRRRSLVVEQRRVIPIAVTGMSCRLPGGIDSPEQLWGALLRGDDFVIEIPRDRWDAEEYYDPEPGVPGRSVSKWGAFLDDVAAFDAAF